MSSTNKNQNGLILDKKKANPSEIIPPERTIAIDSQVKIRRNYATRRSFDVAYKLRILSAYEACETASARGALLRKEGLYHSRVSAWKQQLEHSKTSNKPKLRGILRVDHLTQENEQLKKKLAHAEAIIDLQKKISDLLGTHILPASENELK